MILIPAIDLKGGRCVRLTQGEMDSEIIYSEDPIAIARRWEAEGAERLHIVDLDGAVRGKAVHAEIIEKIVQSITIPVEIGGGIREIDRIDRYFAAGARWAILGTAALQDESLVREACKKFPRRIIAGIDSKNGRVAIRGWTELYDLDVADLALRMQDMGVAAIILTDIEKDGMMEGPNLDLLQEVGMQIEIPIIASGGITTLSQIERLTENPGIEGAIIGKALYTGKLSLPEALAAVRGGK